MSQAGKTLYLVANWKSHKTWAETEVYLGTFRGFREEGNVISIICPPFPYLKPARELINSLHLPLKLGAQDVSPYPFGAYTGAVSASMLASYVDYVLVGHSERRRYFHETDHDVANKIKELNEVSIKPIICVDEPYLASQITAIEPQLLTHSIFAYEPISAIGSGLADTPEHAQTVAEQIHRLTQPNLPVLYGGSVTAENLTSFLSLNELQGALIGGASLDYNTWKILLNQAKDF